MKSPKESHLEDLALKHLNDLPLKCVKLLFADREIKALQEYANIVSIKRLGYNDHGPVHMRQVLLNATYMMTLLNQKNIKFNLETEDVGTYEDSIIAVMLASFLHDLGMTIAREDHESNSIILAVPIIDRILNELYDDNLEKKVIVRSMAIEGIMGHMASKKIHSLEAGVILVADGCDMQKGRSRIPLMINTESRIGDIHKYSSASIEKVHIEQGQEKPIKITIEMSASVGFFQVEEVLLGKISVSPAKQYIEVVAGVQGQEAKRYL